MAARAGAAGLIAVALIAFVAFDGPGLGERRGPPAEELVVEKTVLKPGIIELTVRNDGPDAVRSPRRRSTTPLRSSPAPTSPSAGWQTTKVRVQQPWVEGEAYEVALMSSTGATTVHAIDAAVRRRTATCRSSA